MMQKMATYGAGMLHPRCPQKRCAATAPNAERSTANANRAIAMRERMLMTAWKGFAPSVRTELVRAREVPATVHAAKMRAQAAMGASARFMGR